METPRDLVRIALLTNAGFSLLTGLLLAAVPGTVGAWLGVSIDGWLRLLGLGLIGHVVLLVWASSQDSFRTLALWNLVAIAPYPLLMVILVATGLVDRTLGQGLALADGAIVGAIAVMHWLGLRNGDVAVRT